MYMRKVPDEAYMKNVHEESFRRAFRSGSKMTVWADSVLIKAGSGIIGRKIPDCLCRSCRHDWKAGIIKEGWF